MAPPLLRIPISANMTQFQQDMGKLTQVTRQTTQQIARQFIDMNKTILDSGLTSMASLGREFATTQVRAAAAAVAIRVAWVGAALVVIEVLTAIIRSIQEQIDSMNKLADAANKVGVSPEFFQQFISGSRNMRIAAADLEAALTSAFQTMKEQIDPNWTVFDVGAKKITDVHRLLLELRELFTTFQNFRGLELFRSAENQEQRVRAILAAMVELESAGHRLQALNLAEVAFGPQFADRIRQGATSAQELLSALERSPQFSSRLVEDTKETTRQLDAARQRMDEALRPGWDELIQRANAYKRIWAGIVDLTATAVQLMSKIPGFGGVPRPTDTTGVTADEAQRIGTFGARSGLPAAPPFPRPRPFTEPPRVTETATEAADAVENLIERMQRAQEMAEAELRTIGMSNVERERAVALARAASAARQAGRDLTEEETQEIIRLAEAHGRLADQLKAIQAIQSEIRELGSAFADAFKSATIEGQKLDEVLKRLLQRLASRAIDTAFNVAFNAIANAIVPGLVGPGGGVLPGGRPLGQGGIGSAQHGGPVSAGRPYVVGERGPELMVPRMSGFVVPNNQLGGMTFSPTTMIDARGSQMTEHQMAAVVAQGNARLYQQIKKDLPAWQSRYSKLGRT